ncbi:MAG: bacteriocin export transporter permease/ATPase subunit [Burkholderia sp.]|nr:bacteriocin export transporter permease/ATPase subunit [Burkholderia sp.]
MSAVASELMSASGRYAALEFAGTRLMPLALEPVLLGTGNTMWLVEEGGVDLFHVPVNDGMPSGARRHVCRIEPGAVVIDRPGAEDSALLAVALSGTVWLRFENGGAALKDNPATAAMLQSLEDGWRVCLQCALSGLSADALAPGASHRTLLAFLEQRAKDALAAEQAAMHASARNEALTLHHALSDVAQVLSTSDDGTPAAGGNPLFGACAIVLQAAGIAIRSQDGVLAADDTSGWLEKFCRRNRLAQRPVDLSAAGWWRHDLGPLLGFRSDGGLPVALVADETGYLLTDPATGSRCRVNEQVAASLGRRAIMFFSSLPAGKLRLRDLLQFSLAGSRRDYRRLLGFGLAGGVLGMVSPFVTRLLVDSVLPSANRNELLQLVLMLALTAAGVAAFSFCRGLAANRVRSRLGNNMQAAVIDRLLSLPAPFFREHEAGDLAQRAMAIESILQKISGTAESAVFGWVFGLFSLFYLFFLDAGLGLLAVLLVGLKLIWTLGLDYRALRLQRHGAKLSGEIASRVFQILNGIAKLRSQGAENRAFALWAALFSRQKSLDVRVRRVGITLGTIDGAYGLVCSMAMFAAVAFLTPDMRPGVFISFSAAFGQFIGATMALSAALTGMLAVIPLYERALPILQTEPESADMAQAPGLLSGAIDISGVSFRYNADGPDVLDNLSISIVAGEFVALVGPSGCGKSTLCRLLLGFEQAQSGAIYFDGQDLAGLDRVAVRRQIGVVLQNGQLMAGDIFSNIVGASRLSMDDAWEAVKLAGLENELRSMPMGMHTMISEGSSTISGGQKQRLMVARAIVRKPKILLFDEATSALDNTTQAIVTKSIATLQATRIVIAHRLSTIIGADRIFFIEHGRVAKSGTFEQLMQLNGRFKALAERQLT